MQTGYNPILHTDLPENPITITLHEASTVFNCFSSSSYSSLNAQRYLADKKKIYQFCMYAFGAMCFWVVTAYTLHTLADRNSEPTPENPPISSFSLITITVISGTLALAPTARCFLLVFKSTPPVPALGDSAFDDSTRGDVVLEPRTPASFV